MISPISVSAEAIEIFFSYAHTDEQWRNELEKHLSPLMRLGLITSWYDRKIFPGSEWAKEIDNHLNSSQIVLLLISADFIASDYCRGIEMMRALERYHNGVAIVIPIIVRPVIWQKEPFGTLQALPIGGKAITTWPNVDEALFDVASGIEKTVKKLATNGHLGSLDVFSRIDNSDLVPSDKQKSTRSQIKVPDLKRSADWRKLKACKNTLEVIKEQLSEVSLRNMHEKDLKILKQKVRESKKEIENINNKQIVDKFIKSINILYEDIQQIIWVIDAILLMFAKLLLLLDRTRLGGLGDSDLQEITLGVREFYISLDNCQKYFDEALSQILI